MRKAAAYCGSDLPVNQAYGWREWLPNRDASDKAKEIVRRV